MDLESVGCYTCLFCVRFLYSALQCLLNSGGCGGTGSLPKLTEYLSKRLATMAEKKRDRGHE